MLWKVLPRPMLSDCRRGGCRHGGAARRALTLKRHTQADPRAPITRLHAAPLQAPAHPPTWMQPLNSGSTSPARHLNMNWTWREDGNHTERIAERIAQRWRGGWRQHVKRRRAFERWLCPPAIPAASSAARAPLLAHPLHLMRAQLAGNKFVHQHPRVGGGALAHRRQPCPQVQVLSQRYSSARSWVQAAVPGRATGEALLAVCAQCPPSGPAPSSRPSTQRAPARTWMVGGVKQQHVWRLGVVGETVPQAAPNLDHLCHRRLQRAARPQLRQLAEAHPHLHAAPVGIGACSQGRLRGGNGVAALGNSLGRRQRGGSTGAATARASSSAWARPAQADNNTP